MSIEENDDALQISDSYQRLLEEIPKTYDRGRIRATQAVNAQLIETYWEIG